MWLFPPPCVRGRKLPVARSVEIPIAAMGFVDGVLQIRRGATRGQRCSSELYRYRVAHFVVVCGDFRFDANVVTWSALRNARLRSKNKQGVTRRGLDRNANDISSGELRNGGLRSVPRVLTAKFLLLPGGFQPRVDESMQCSVVG